MRYSLRDLFWLTLAVAVGLSSWLSGELTGRRNEVADAEQRRKARPPPPPPPGGNWTWSAPYTASDGKVYGGGYRQIVVPPPPPSPGTIGLILETSDDPYFREPLERLRNLYAEPLLPLEAPSPIDHSSSGDYAEPARQPCE